MLSIILLGFINLVNSIAIRQYSDDGCTLLSRIDYLDNSNCYSFVSTGSYLIKTCNCSLVEYNVYDGALCLGNFIGSMVTQQDTCLTTRQKISCYDNQLSNTCSMSNIFIIGTIFSLLVT